MTLTDPQAIPISSPTCNMLSKTQMNWQVPGINPLSSMKDDDDDDVPNE